MRTDAAACDVLAKLVAGYPFGWTAAELREACGLGSGQEIAGILRSLRTRGIIDRRSWGGRGNTVWFATAPAVATWTLARGAV